MSDIFNELLSKMQQIEENAKQFRHKNKKSQTGKQIEKQIDSQPKEFPIVKAECLRCNRKYIGRAISFTVSKNQYIPWCPKCMDIDLWWLHYYISEVKEVEGNE